MVNLFDDDPAGAFREALERTGAVVGNWDADLRAYFVTASPAELEALIRLDFVLFVEPVLRARTFHDESMALIGVDGHRAESDDTNNCSRGRAVTVTDESGFTNDPIVAGETPVRAVHFTELRQRIDALRVAHGLGRFPWTNPRLAAGITIRGVHMAELRTALRQAYDAAGRTSGFRTEAPQAGWAIHAWDINELRHWVVALER